MFDAIKSRVIYGFVLNFAPSNTELVIFRGVKDDKGMRAFSVEERNGLLSFYRYLCKCGKPVLLQRLHPVTFCLYKLYSISSHSL